MHAGAGINCIAPALLYVQHVDLNIAACNDLVTTKIKVLIYYSYPIRGHQTCCLRFLLSPKVTTSSPSLREKYIINLLAFLTESNVLYSGYPLQGT